MPQLWAWAPSEALISALSCCCSLEWLLESSRESKKRVASARNCETARDCMRRRAAVLLPLAARAVHQHQQTGFRLPLPLQGPLGAGWPLFEPSAKLALSELRPRRLPRPGPLPLDPQQADRMAPGGHRIGLSDSVSVALPLQGLSRQTPAKEKTRLFLATRGTPVLAVLRRACAVSSGLFTPASASKRQRLLRLQDAAGKAPAPPACPLESADRAPWLLYRTVRGARGDDTLP